MESMMATGWKRGLEEAGIAGSTSRVLGMDLGFIGSIHGMFMQESGLMGKGMAVEFIPVRMEADMLGNSNGESRTLPFLEWRYICRGIFCRQDAWVRNLSFANGHRYEGAWHEGKRQGLGIYMFINGETQSGHWQNGILNVQSTQSFTYPVSPVAVYHSTVLNAVQEARRAAKRAYDVAKVDERVNKAVAAGNRAANAARVIAVQKQMHHNNFSDNIPIPIM